MPQKSILIIGAGVAGLSAGCYTQMNGYETQIFEAQDHPGGLCSAWDRQGYRIDPCLRWLPGTSPKSIYYHLWQEVGALQSKTVINMEIFCHVENALGQGFDLYTDIDKLQAHMLELAPEDSIAILELCQVIRKLSRLVLPADKAIELYGLFDNLKALAQIGPYVADLQKWGKTTILDLSLKFQNPLLREAWQKTWPLDASSLYIILTLAWMSQSNAGYVLGGSREIIRSMEKRYLDLGGKIHYRSRVSTILVEDNRAAGIVLQDGREYRADDVISAADGHTTIFEMLDGRYLDDKIRGHYANMPVFKSLVFIALGVNRTFEDLPQIITGLFFPLAKPISVAGKEEKSLGVRISNFDPTLAPPGKSVMTVMFETEFAYWEALYRDQPAYAAEKARLAREVIEALDQRFPGLAEKVEMTDVSTPVTFQRFTGNWQGSKEGWLLTPANLTLRIKKTLPGLSHFYMVGQWVQPGGSLPSGLMTGCHMTQLLCKSDSQKYCTVCP